MFQDNLSWLLTSTQTNAYCIYHQSGNSALLLASYSGFKDVVAALLAAGADPNANSNVREGGDGLDGITNFSF